MITFRKFAAASDGKLVRMYFTEARLDPQQTEQTADALGRQLEPGSRLTSYYTGRDAGPAWRSDMPLSVARALGINSHHAPKDEELDRLFEGKRADTVSAVSVPLPLEWKNSLQFVATRHCTPLAQSFASD